MTLPAASIYSPGPVQLLRERPARGSETKRKLGVGAGGAEKRSPPCSGASGTCLKHRTAEQEYGGTKEDPPLGKWPGPQFLRFLRVQNHSRAGWQCSAKCFRQNREVGRLQGALGGLTCSLRNTASTT